MADKKKTQKNITEQKGTKVSKNKSGLFAIIMLFIPVLFFVLLELLLRLFNYGYNNSQWIELNNEKLTLNPQIANRYFYSLKRLPESIHDTFDKEKRQNAFRVFILGESSAAGFPYMPIGSFSRYLQKRLELVYPESKIEVVNIGMTAINSYALLDLFPGVLEQKPDLVIIYTGHNEYYGALGIGSMESISSSRAIIKSILFLNNFKTYVLLKDAVKYFSGLISSAPSEEGTLMSRMAKEQAIVYNSEQYKKGIEQFENNLDEILSHAKERRVPVILSTLVSNLKNQYPFISKQAPGLPSAETIFQKAKEELRLKNNKTADSLFCYARDLDLLRFRAPGEINEKIIEAGRKYEYPVIKLDAIFNSVSPDGISGDNLICDHLHPNLNGYKLMGKVFYEEMKKNNQLPASKEKYSDLIEQDSLTLALFAFSRLDSLTAEYGLKILKNDWPFINIKNKRSIDQIIIPENYIDSLGLEVVENKLEWEAAERKAASWYLKQNKYAEFRNQMEVLISQYPYVMEYYDLAGEGLLKLQRYDDAFVYLQKRFLTEPNAFSAKWLGIISLKNKKNNDAIFYLNRSVELSGSDAQVFFNLATAFVYDQKYNLAYDKLKKCLSLKPNYPGVQKLIRIVDQILHSKKPVAVKVD